MAQDPLPPIRDAASVILVRDPETAPAVLMGQRGAKAAFMPSKFVFPGGAVDAGDAGISLAAPLDDRCTARLSTEVAGNSTADQLAVAAIRELWEETGLRLAAKGLWPDPAPEGWQSFAASGLQPTAAAMHFVFRAITPPGRPRRFDARFFLMDATAIHDDLDDFSAASDELSHLHWVPLGEIGNLDLPFITEVVLAEVKRILPHIGTPDRVPFFDNTLEFGQVRYL